MRKLNLSLNGIININSSLLICICLLSVTLQFSFEYNESYNIEKESKKIFSGNEIYSGNIKFNEKKFFITGIHESVNTIKSRYLKKINPLKRPKNRPVYIGIFPGNSFNAYLLNEISVNSRSPYINISYLKFLRISKMLC